MSSYPQTLAEVLPDARLLFEIGRNREIATRKAEFAHSGWRVAGFGLRQSLGEPDNADNVFGAGADSDDDLQSDEETCSAMLEFAEANGIAVPMKSYAAGPVGKINWKKLVEIFLMIAPLFLESVPE